MPASGTRVLPAHGDGRRTGVVAGLQGDHFAARFHERGERRGDGFGSACGDQHFGLGVGYQVQLPVPAGPFRRARWYGKH